MRVRPATTGDISSIMRLADSSPTAGHWSHEQYERAFAGESPRRAVWVAEDLEIDDEAKSAPAEIAGFLIAREIAGEWEIENIVVKERARRRHLASQLLLRLQDVALAERASAIFLEVRESNQAARAFYQSRGFREIGARPGYYSDPIEDAITYRLLLE